MKNMQKEQEGTWFDELALTVHVCMETSFFIRIGRRFPIIWWSLQAAAQPALHSQPDPAPTNRDSFGLRKPGLARLPHFAWCGSCLHDRCHASRA